MPVTSIFTYVNDTDVSSFMNNINDYESKVVFLGSSYQIATKNKIYGNKQGDWNTTDPDDPSYINNKPTVVSEETDPTVPSYVKAITASNISFWDNKQDAILDINTIRENAEAGANKVSNVQGDWNETDPSKPSYIVNKPTIGSGGNIDLSTYVSKNELSEQSYAGYSYVYDAYAYVLNAIIDNEYVIAYGFNQLNYKIENINDYVNLSDYMTKSAMSTYAKKSDLNTYAKKTDLAAYVKITDLSAQGYLTSHQDLTNYATKTYVVENFTSYAYIEERLADIDMSTYVSKTELANQSYVTDTFVSNNYPTYTYFEQRLENIDLANYVSKIELANQSYASTSYVENAYSYVLEKISILELSTGGGGSGTSAEGGITSIMFNGSPASITGSVATINNPVYDSTITIRMNNSTVDTFTLNAQTAKTIDIGNVTVPSDLNDYVSKTELSNAGYITSGLPSVTSNDNGKILMVVNGAWTLVSPSTIYSGNATPSNANGNNGDIYLQS